MRFKEGRRQSKQQNSTRLHKGGKYEKRKGEKGPTWTAFEKRAPLLSSPLLSVFVLCEKVLTSSSCVPFSDNFDAESNAYQ